MANRAVLATTGPNANGPKKGLRAHLPRDPAGQGYLALATGPRKYFELAMNLAASIKAVDPSRRVCLVHDRIAEIPADAHALFDDLAMLKDDPAYRPILNKLRLFDVSPYQQSMFVDADCLLIRHNVSEYWCSCASESFAITGQVLTDGVWKGNPVKGLLETYQVPYVVMMNSGVFYFDKSEQAAAFFAELNGFYRMHSETLVALDGPWRHEDELFFGVVMGRVGLLPKLHADRHGNTIMATTWRAPICLADPSSGRSVLIKPTGFLFDVSVLPRGFRRLSPTFMHFVGLKPKRLYRRLSSRLRRAALQVASHSGLRQDTPP